MNEDITFDPRGDEDWPIRCVKSTIGSVEAEGGKVTAKTKIILERYAKGEITVEEAKKKVRSQHEIT